MRYHGAQAGIEHAECFSLHDLRRGAAKQLVAGGCTLSVLLRAGSWSSRAFMIYLDQPGLERDAQASVLNSFVDIEDGDT